MLPSQQLVHDDATKDIRTLFTEGTGFEGDKVATLEVTNGSRKLFASILEYAACHAVPIGKSHSVADKKMVGTLNRLWSPPLCTFRRRDRIDWAGDASFSEDDEIERDVQKAMADLRNELPETALAQVDVGSGGVHGLRKEAKLPSVKWQAGLGYAKVIAGGAHVYMHHYVIGAPIAYWYTIDLFRAITLAAGDVEILKEFCLTALKWKCKREQELKKTKMGKYVLYRFKLWSSGCGEWEYQGLKSARPAKTVILQKGQLQAIIKDVKNFVSGSTKEWYQNHGLPHRRCLLFHGVPGSGKTSSIRVLAGLFNLNACFLSLSGSKFDNQDLQDAMARIPERALLVVEDCDALFNESRMSEGDLAVTFSAFLNCLDGLTSTESIITVLTTNHVQKLDPALIRGGRVDRCFEFVRPDQEQLCNLFLSFYRDAPQRLALEFAQRILERKETEARSIATLQEHFIYTRTRSAEDCIEALPQFFAEFYPKGIDQRQSLYV